MKPTREALANIKDICDELLFGDRLKRAASQEQKMMEFAGALAEIGHTADGALAKTDSVHVDKPLAESAVAPGECGSVPDIQWRKLLAITYCGFPALYCDDGELQDNRTHPCIDFKRDSVDEIWDKMRSRTTSALQSGISSLDRRPNEKTFADKTGTFADTSNCFIQTEQPRLSDSEIINTLAKHGIGLLGHTSGVEPFPLDGDDAPIFIAAYRALLSAQRQDSDKAEQSAMYQWIRSNVSEDMQWYLFGHVVNSPEDFDKAIRAAIANGAPK